MTTFIRDRTIILSLGTTAFKGLRIDYKITKTLKKKPLNKASIEIYGLSKASASKLAETASKQVDIPPKLEYNTDLDLANELVLFGAEPLETFTPDFSQEAADFGGGAVVGTLKPGQTRYTLTEGGTKTITIPGTRIRLFAGHNDRPQLIFEGNIIKDGLEVTREGPQRIVRIEAADGFQRFQKAKVRKSFEGEVTAQEILKECAGQLGLPAGVISIPDDTFKFSSGVVLDDRVEVVLDQIANAVGADWSIVDGSLQFLGKDQTRTNEGPVLSPENRNLLSIEPKDDGALMRIIQDPLIVPGDRVVVRDTESFDGTWKVTKIMHNGTLYGDMVSEITAERYVANKPAPTVTEQFVNTINRGIEKIRDEALEAYTDAGGEFPDEYPPDDGNADFN